MDYAKVASNIRTELKNYLEESGLKSLVIGISGGIDSALCVALAKPVCDELGVKLIGRSITIESNKDDERERADKVGKAFCHSYEEINLTSEYSVMSNTFNYHEGKFSDSINDKIRKGNIKARMRMMYLYNLAQLHRGMVLSTDNYTELMLGFWTLHGDVGDYGMVQNLWKMEVYELSKWIAANECDDASGHALLDCVEATPTDGLGITNSDLDQLGVKTYAEADDILQSWFDTDDMLLDDMIEHQEKLKDHPIIQRHMNSRFKRNNPYNLTRRDILEGAV